MYAGDLQASGESRCVPGGGFEKIAELTVLHPRLFARTEDREGNIFVRN